MTLSASYKNVKYLQEEQSNFFIELEISRQLLCEKGHFYDNKFIMPRLCVFISLAVLHQLTVTQLSPPPIPTFVPVLSTGIGPKIPSEVGYRVESFGEGAYMLADGIYQSMFLVATESVIVVDAPPTTGHNILKGIRSVTDLPISHVIYSHSHADHIGAAYLIISENTTVISHQDTVPLLAASVDGARPLPNITFSDDYELNVDNQTLQLSYKGLNHDPGNIFIYAPCQKVVMLVDIIYPGWAPFSRLGESQNIPGWIHAHDQVLEYDFDHLISGHVNRAGTREDVLIQREYVTDLYNNCVEAIQLSAETSNDTNSSAAFFSLAAIAAANPNNPWALTSYYVDDLLTEYCNNKTNEKWLSQLAGADVYGRSNANTMVESLRLDFGVLGPVGVQSV